MRSRFVFLCKKVFDVFPQACAMLTTMSKNASAYMMKRVFRYKTRITNTKKNLAMRVHACVYLI